MQDEYNVAYVEDTNVFNLSCEGFITEGGFVRFCKVDGKGDKWVPLCRISYIEEV